MATRTKLAAIIVLCVVVLGSFGFWWFKSTPHKTRYPVKLETRVFKVDPVQFADALRGIPDLQTNNVGTMAESIFSKAGVHLTTPGRSIAFNDKLGLLFVKATSSELRIMERAIQALNQVAPQIHMKAYFIEVPKEGFVMPQISGNTAAGELTGILTGEQTKTLLQSLREKSGAEILAEPEVVTTSGRQTQMRATDQIGAGPIVDLVPNVFADNYTINLKVLVTSPVSLSALVNIYDGQAVVLSETEKSGDKQLIVLVTATMVDPAGNRVHSGDELPFNPSTFPPQPK